MSDRFTRLEREVMAALAHDLRHIAPDLAGQFEESLPGTRRNTGSGLFSEIIVSSRRPLSAERATGLFGTVHAMVGDLPDPIAFQAELREGRLLALHGDAYGQDTRALDFECIPFDQVFTLNDQGESIAFDPAAQMRPSPLLALHQHDDPDPAPALEPRLVNIGPLERLQDDRPQPLVKGVAPEAPQPDADREATKSLLIGIWVAAAVVALLAVVFARVSVVLVLIGAFWLGALLRKPAAKRALAGAAKTLGGFEVRPSQF
ncbi:hypothetical protein [Brevundimonas sp.]|uniref:hypothetical protein n=1 Tax=Brevundimonas sp. TaxID=1871086 RepID=UPI002FC68884